MIFWIFLAPDFPYCPLSRVLMVHKIDRPNTTPIGPLVLSLTFNSKFGSDCFCTKGLEGLNISLSTG